MAWSCTCPDGSCIPETRALNLLLPGVPSTLRLRQGLGLGGLLALGSREGGEAGSQAAQHLRDLQVMLSTGPAPD